MKYFMHHVDQRYEPEFQSLLENKANSMLFYGAANIVLEVLSQHSKSKGDDFAQPLEGKFGLDFWRREFYVRTRGDAMAILVTLAACNIIDEDALLQSKTVSAPLLRTRLDEYTAKKAKKKGSVEAEAQAEAT